MNIYNASENVSSLTSKFTSESTLKNKIKMKSLNKIKIHSENKIKKSYNFQTPPGAPAPPTAKKTDNNPPIKTNKNDSNSLPINTNKNDLKVENKKDENTKKEDPKSNQKDIILNDWLLISSGTFRNSAVFPEINMGYLNSNLRIKFDSFDFRINDAHAKDESDNDNSPSHDKLFWFRLTKDHIFYSSTKQDLNILGGNKIEHIIDAVRLKKDSLGFFCFSINDKSGHDWKICSESEKIRNNWFCNLQKLRGKEVENYCKNNEDDSNANIIYKNVSNFKFFIIF